mgnify:CR=1 FL=1
MSVELSAQVYSFLAQLVYFDPLRPDGTPYLSHEQSSLLPFTVGELLHAYTSRLHTEKDPLKPKKLTGIAKWVYEDQIHFLTNPENAAYKNWIVCNICAHNGVSNSGLYGFTVRMESDAVAIVFRGNEDPSDHLNDWRTSLDIANNTFTAQHREALAYIRTHASALGRSDLKIFFIGHSLGGHIAELCTFLSPQAVKQNICACVTFNAPGFNNAFLKKYHDEIEEQNAIITNYQNENDFVSSLLTSPVPPIILHSSYQQFNFFCNHAISSYRTDSDSQFVLSQKQEKSFICGGVYSWSLGIQKWPKIKQERAKLFWMSIFQSDPLYIKTYFRQVGLFLQFGISAVAQNLLGVR